MFSTHQAITMARTHRHTFLPYPPFSTPPITKPFIKMTMSIRKTEVSSGKWKAYLNRSLLFLQLPPLLPLFPLLPPGLQMCTVMRLVLVPSLPPVPRREGPSVLLTAAQQAVRVCQAQESSLHALPASFPPCLKLASAPGYSVAYLFCRAAAAKVARGQHLSSTTAFHHPPEWSLASSPPSVSKLSYLESTCLVP